jgi:DNA-binding NtrC family response regulator
MVANWSKLDEVNVLASAADWAWPEALQTIFRPRGINLLVADTAGEFLGVIRRKRIHATIVDMDSRTSDGLATVKIIRIDHPLQPCILLSNSVNHDMLGKALQLEVFGVIDKPVNMDILRELLNRLFLKKYNCDIFAANLNMGDNIFEAY